MNKLPPALLYGGLLAGAGVATYFTWRQFFWRTEGEPGSVLDPSAPTGETKQVTGYVKGQPVQLAVTSVGNGKFARADAAAAFRSMQDAAKAQGVDLEVISAFRTQEEQQVLYAAYLKGTGNLAAKPGFSNHQAGLSFDLSTGFKGSPTYQWLKANASRYGFVNDVPSEHWHWTYTGSSAVSGLGSLSTNMSPSATNPSSWLLAAGLAALVVYQVAIRPDEGPRTLRRGASTDPTPPNPA